MKNKILTEIYVAQLDEKFNVYLPLNKNVANTIELICKAISEHKRITSCSKKPPQRAEYLWETALAPVTVSSTNSASPAWS